MTDQQSFTETGIERSPAAVLVVSTQPATYQFPAEIATCTKITILLWCIAKQAQLAGLQGVLSNLMGVTSFDSQILLVFTSDHPIGISQADIVIPSRTIHFPARLTGASPNPIVLQNDDTLLIAVKNFLFVKGQAPDPSKEARLFLFQCAFDECKTPEEKTRRILSYLCEQNMRAEIAKFLWNGGDQIMRSEITKCILSGEDKYKPIIDMLTQDRRLLERVTWFLMCEEQTDFLFSIRDQII